MITRQDYLFKGGSSDEERTQAHRAYYAQFVNEAVKQRVLNRWSLQDLQKSFAKDKHFNTKITPIEAWDSLAGFAFNKTTGDILQKPYTSEPIDSKLLKETGEGFSSSTAVSTYKEAARQIIEEAAVTFLSK